MTTGVLFYEHVASNWGDLAINAGAVELLRRSGADVESSSIVRMRPNDAYARIASLSAAGPASRDLTLDTKPKGGSEEIELLVRALENPVRFAEEYGILEHDVVLLNSGEHIFESSTGGNTLDLIWRLVPAVAAVTTGRRAVLLPSTLGPFSTQLGLAIDSFLTDGMSAAAYRDTESRRLAPSEASRERPVLLDPGFFATGELAPLRNLPPKTVGPGKMGIVLRLEEAGIRTGSRRSAFVQAKFRGSEFRDSQAFQLFRDVASQHLKAGGEVAITVQTRADREISVALHTSLLEEHGSDRLVLHDPEHFSDYLSAVADVDILVTSRFHAVILAESQGVPSVGIYSESHGHKMPGLLDLLGKPDCAIRLDDRLPSHVAVETRGAIARAIEVQSEVRRRIDDLRESTVAWLASALQAPVDPTASPDELRIQALAALARTGLHLSGRAELDQLRRAVQKLTRIITEED